MIAIPLALTLVRVILGPIALWMALEGVVRELFVYVLVGGLLSDYFDGVLARWLGVVRPWLRRLDSSVDLVFYFFILAATYVVEGEKLKAAALPLGLLVASEACCVGACLLKFGTLPAAHTYSAKLYGLVIFVAFLGVLSFGLGPWVFWVAGGFALLANGEVLSIILLSEEPPVDVPSVVRVLRLTGRN